MDTRKIILILESVLCTVFAALLSSTAISIYMKGVAAQAADELLGVADVSASFVLSKTGNDEISISGRSLGAVNVQLIAETLGGGGHQTMAGSQLKGITFEEATEKLKTAIDKYYNDINT